MITVIVDDKKFTLSYQTLNANPQFVITQILNGSVPANNNPFVERINETTFEVDTDPEQFTQVVYDLRKEPRNFFVLDQKDQNKTGSIFQKSNINIDNVSKLLGGSMLNSTTDQHTLSATVTEKRDSLNGSLNSSLNGSLNSGHKTHYVLKPRKIELDTSENRN